MRIQVWAIGLFLVLGLGFAAVILFSIGSREKAFGRHQAYYAEFSSLGGVEKGAAVRVSGLNAGQLKEIEIPKTPSAKFRLKLQLDDKVRDLVRADSLVTIETEGVVGDKFLLITKGTDTSETVQPGATLRSKEPFDLGVLMEKASALLTGVQSSLDEVRGRLDLALGTVNTTVAHADALIVRVSPPVAHATVAANQMITDLNAGRGSAGLLLRDDVTREQLRSTLLNINQTSADAKQAVEGIKGTVTDLQTRKLAENLQRSLDNVQLTTRQLNSALSTALSQDSLGQHGPENLRDTLSNLNLGTANLAEDTEALKHNFFLRGFFKKRGFYSLDQLTASDYEAALKRQKLAVTRIWIQSSVFAAGVSGSQEELTETGRMQIDDAVAGSVEKLPGGIIVVEGYAIGGSPDEQFVVARRRADLVRRYLELHFHLRGSDVGIVPLLTHPPIDSGKSSWDGAAIMLLPLRTKP